MDTMHCKPLETCEERFLQIWTCWHENLIHHRLIQLSSCRLLIISIQGHSCTSIATTYSILLMTCSQFAMNYANQISYHVKTHGSVIWQIVIIYEVYWMTECTWVRKVPREAQPSHTINSFIHSMNHTHHTCIHIRICFNTLEVW